MKTTNKTIKKILSIALCLALVMSYVPMVNITASAVATDLTVTIDTGASVTLQDADGDSFYDIGTADELYAFAAAVNGGNGTINGELTADIVVNENVLDENGELNGDGSNFRVWTPIGVYVDSYDATNVFHGQFNGNNHTVSGLYFNNESQNYVGLFGCTKGATIKGIGVLDCYINGQEFVGGVVGYLRSGTLEDCYNTGSVLGFSVVGGVAGWAGYSSTAQTCFNAGNVSGRSNSIGGVVGRTWNNATVKNCYSTGKIVLLGASQAGKNTTRGVVGDGGTNTVENCYFLENTVTIGDAEASNGYVYSGTQAMSFAQFVSGEVAYKLGSAFGQTLEGENRQNYPVLGGTPVNYGFTTCDEAQTTEIYTNEKAFNTKPDHNWKDGVCQNGCGDIHSPHTGGSYSASGNVIAERCTVCDAAIVAVTFVDGGKVYDGKPFIATVTGEGTLANAEVAITYCCEGGCVKVGEHTASITMGEFTATADFTIEKRELKLKLTDCYKEYDGTNSLTRYTVELENFVFYDEGDYVMNDYLDYDDVYDDVGVDLEKLNVTLSDCVPGTYATATVSGITLTGETAGNYTIAETLENVQISGYYGDFEIGNATVTITSLDQNMELGAGLDQTSYTVEGLPQGCALNGVVLEKDGNRITVNTEAIVITDADGAYVTAYFNINTYNDGIVTETCVGHTFNADGFCATGKCRIYEAAKLNDNGTEDEYDDYYEISNAGQLFWFAEYVANVSNEVNAKLTDNITIPEGKTWTPIDNLYGTFDGNYKTISGLQVSDTDSDYVGFLGYIGYWADVRNLHITNSSFIDADATYVGAIVGYHGGGEITNCYIDETVKVESNGVCGALVGYTAYTTMKNCYAHDVLAGNGHYGTFENCYYIGEDDGIDGTTAVTAEQFASGEVAYLLQQGNTEQVWGQDSNQAGAMPVFDSTGLYKVVTVGETGNYSVANVGDTNGDGTVDVVDYQALVNKALADDHNQIETVSYDDIVRYDIDGDGYLDVIDAYLLHLFINGFTTVDVYAVGDYDLNGKAFEEADLKAIKHAIENPEKLATYKKYASDINGDGKLDENDLTALTSKYGEVTGTACADNVEVYYRWGNSYSTCTATAMCTLCGEKVATETVNSVQNADGSYTATFTNTLLGTKTYKK